LYKTAFSALDQHVLSFSHSAHHLLAISAKCTSLYKAAFSAQDQHVLSFSHRVQHVLTFFSKVHEFVQNSVFSPRSARTVIFALGAPILNSFQEIAQVFPKSKTALIASDQHVLSFSHNLQHVLVIFNKKHEFVQRAKRALYKRAFLA